MHQLCPSVCSVQAVDFFWFCSADSKTSISFLMNFISGKRSGQSQTMSFEKQSDLQLQKCYCLLIAHSSNATGMYLFFLPECIPGFGQLVFPTWKYLLCTIITTLWHLKVMQSFPLSDPKCNCSVFDSFTYSLDIRYPFPSLSSL